MIHTFESEIQIVIDNYTEYLQIKGRKSSTVKRYTYDITGCLHFILKEKKEFQSPVWENFHSNDFENYFSMLKNELHYSDKSLHRINIALNKFFHYLVETGIITSSPMAQIVVTEQPDRQLLSTHFLSNIEKDKLLTILTSKKGLTEKQLKYRHLLIERNQSIVHLMLYFGLTLKEIVSIKMNHIHFEQNTIMIPNKKILVLSNEDKKLLFSYYQRIPEPVRPNYHSDDPFFISFDFNRGTFKWVYETESPKALTEISVQKMIRLEVARAGIRKGISAQNLRNTYILYLIESGLDSKQIMYQSGLTSKLALQRYINFHTLQKEVD